ncbi:MAG: glycosyltransferase family 4 protein, partial [Candidatus Omnitrophota bacterium]
MKILVVCYEDMGGNIGGVRQVIEISRHLQKLGHQVEIVAPAIRKYEGEFCGKIRYIPVLWGKFLQPLTYNLTALPVLLTACRELQPDCLLIFEIFSSCAPMLAAKILSLPYAVFVNGDIEDFRLQKFPSIVIWFLERMRHINFIGCKRVFTVSPVLRDSLIKKYAFFPERITVVSNGVDTDLFKPLDRNEALRTLGRSPDYFYIGFVGGMWPWHGLEFLIKSAPAVLEK